MRLTQTLLIAMLAIVFAALPCAGQTPVRVMTYNIHHGEGMDGVVDLDRIAAVIRAEDPDIVCLQEVDLGMERTSGLDMPRLLADKLDMRVVFEPNLRIGEGQYGNATLTRFEILSHGNYLLPNPAQAEPRGCLRTTVRVGDHTLDVLNTHFGLKEDERREQAAYILNTFDRIPMLLAGDLNETTDKPGLAMLLGAFTDSFDKNTGKTTGTIGKGRSTRRIDFVLASKDVRVVSSRVVDTPETRLASDHLPVVAEFDLGTYSDAAVDTGIVSNKDERIVGAIAPHEKGEGSR